MNQLASLGHWFRFGITALLALPSSIARPLLSFRVLYHVLVGALPLAVVAGLSLGIVIWIHTRSVLEKSGTGAVEYLPTFLAVAVLLELAPIAAGLIVAARTGASFGAELAAMKINEQVDALQLLGISPARRLVAPRIWACLFAVPMLHILIASLALGSGYFAELLVGQVTWLKYSAAIMQELYLVDVVPALLKTTVFGFLTALTSSYLGLAATGGSEGVGSAATNSVVICSILVLVADVFLVGLIRVTLA